MKKYTILILSLVLTASLFTGCRSKKPDMTPTSLPTVAPTTMPTTAPTTAPTVPSTAATTEPKETIDHGNGPRDDMESTETTGPESRSRSVMPNVK